MTAPPAIMGVALGNQETLEPNPSRARENKMATDTLGKGHEVLIPEDRNATTGLNGTNAPMTVPTAQSSTAHWRTPLAS